MGYGAIFYYYQIILFSIGSRKTGYGDKFVVSMIIFVILLVVIFIFYPICKLFLLGFINDENSYSFLSLLKNLPTGEFGPFAVFLEPVAAGSS